MFFCSAAAEQKSVERVVFEKNIETAIKEKFKDFSDKFSNLNVDSKNLDSFVRYLENGIVSAFASFTLKNLTEAEIKEINYFHSSVAGKKFIANQQDAEKVLTSRESLIFIIRNACNATKKELSTKEFAQFSDVCKELN